MFPPSQHQGLRHQSSYSRRKLMMTRVAEVAPVMPPFASSSSSSSSFSSDDYDDPSSPLYLPLVQRKGEKPSKSFNLMTAASAIFRSLFPALQALLVPSCKWLSIPPASPTSQCLGRKKVTVTFFGQKKGRVNFAVQEDPRSEPVLLLELATPTSHLIKEMASGMVRILLECEKKTAATTTVTPGKRKQPRARFLWDEPVWTMYCNGHRSGYAVSRPCTGSDFHVLSTVQAVSVGAGVLPPPPLSPPLPPPHPLEMGKGGHESDGCLYDGGGGSEVMYMRARFERVVGSRDSEAFYMINPDAGGRNCNYNNGGPELSVFLLRI